jgi:hypothetical protein
MFARSAEIYSSFAAAEITKHLAFIDSFQLDNVGLYKNSDQE